MAGFDRENVFADNYDFRGVQPVIPQVTATGQLPIGTGGSPAIEVGVITSPLGTLSIGYSNPNITIDLAGGGAGVDSFTTDVAGPVVPNGAGNVAVTGGQVFSNGTIANTLTLAVEATANTFLYGQGNNSAMAELGPLTNGQLIIGSTGVAPVAGSITSTGGSITVTPGAGTIDLAVAASNDAILTVTGDSGGALSPTAGNINVVGLSGSKTSGSGSTLTVKSPPYANASASASSLLNSGEFVTGAFTRTTPLTAGLADGDLLEYVATSASSIVIQLSGTQIAHLGAVATTAAGTLTSTAIGDSISLRYQASTDDWWATSSIGVWILA